MAAVKRSLNVGVVGVGRIGFPILRNLAFKSRAAMYLQVHSRDLKKATRIVDTLSGDAAPCAFRLHNQYSTMTKWCDVIICCLKDADASRNVLLEHQEALLTHARPGQIIIDHTTTDVATAKRFHDAARRTGAMFLDAPISGNHMLAHNGQLTIMAGGEGTTYAKVLPMLRLYAENVSLVGDGGCGAAAKAITQSLVAMHTIAAAEALSMAHRFGLSDSRKLLDVLDGSWGSSTMLRRCAPNMQKNLRNPDEVPDKTPTSVDWLLSDLAVVADSLAEDDRQMPLALPLLARSRSIFAKCAHAGVGDRDVSAVAHFIEADATAQDFLTNAPSSPSSPVAATPEPDKQQPASRNPSQSDMEFY